MALEDQFSEDDIKDLERRFVAIEEAHANPRSPWAWTEDLEDIDFGWGMGV